MEIKRDEIKEEFLEKPSGLYEIRILTSGGRYNPTLSAYVDASNLEDVLNQIEAYKVPEGSFYNIFLGVNPCREYCRSREQYGRLISTRNTTQDEDIDRIKWLVVDIDSPHPTGVSATDDEKHIAFLYACKVVEYMSFNGWSAPETVDSGNGYHLKWRVDLNNDEGGRELISDKLEELRALFPYTDINGQTVYLIDTSVKNPSRILKTPGSLNMKGRSTEERPHRWARLMEKAEPTE